MKNEAISPTPKVLAGDEHWRWLLFDREDEGPTWQLQWHTSDSLSRHLRRLSDENLCQILFPFELIGDEVGHLALVAAPGRPLSSVEWRGLPQLSIRKLFEGLGARLRSLHDLSAPSGFGDPDVGQRYQTINAYMAAYFSELGQRLKFIESDEIREKALQSLADLRLELSVFHPHGKSCWTVGRLSSERMLYDKDTGRIEGILDLGSTILRPPEYDLASLRVCGLLSDHPVADRAFWKGYQAAVTRDLERRCAYFERLIELERILSVATKSDISKSDQD